MDSILGVGSFLSEHPVIGLIVFLAVSAGVIFVLSGGRLVEALRGIFRTLLTIFTTPFVFLRDALTILRTAGEAEKDYQRTRVFMLYRYSRIQYLLLLVGALLVLSGGITTSLLSLYPQQEIEMGRTLSERVNQLRDEVREAEEAVRATGSPDHRQNLEKARDEAHAAHQQAQRDIAAFVQTAPVPGPYVNQIRNAYNADAANQQANGVLEQLANCPEGWPGYTQQECDAIRNFATGLGQRRVAELTTQQAFNDAQRAFRDADSAAAQANARLESARSQLDQAREQRGRVSLFNPSVLGDRIIAAITTLLSTALAVVVLVWFGAIIIDVANWTILLMRGAEKDNLAKLDHSSSEYQG